VTVRVRLRPLMTALGRWMVHVGGTLGRNTRGWTARIEDPRHFLELGFGYYMTGRFAAINLRDSALIR
jgi:hypothetical protein